MILLPEDEPPARGIGAMLWLRLALTAVLFGVLVWLVAVAARGWPLSWSARSRGGWWRGPGVERYERIDGRGSRDGASRGADGSTGSASRPPPRSEFSSTGQWRRSQASSVVTRVASATHLL